MDGIPRVIDVSGSWEAYVRRSTHDEWLSANPVLADLELGWESDTDRFKVGDGKTEWCQLSYYIKDGR